MHISTVTFQVSSVTDHSLLLGYTYTFSIIGTFMMQFRAGKDLLYGFSGTRFRPRKSTALRQRTERPSPHSEREHARRAQVRRAEGGRLCGARTAPHRYGKRGGNPDEGTSVAVCRLAACTGRAYGADVRAL